jgi:hypothetical protein
VNKLIKLAPIGSIAQELVRFDLQQLENPEISGIEYQQGTLLGYEVREYLLDAWDRKCAYCGIKIHLYRSNIFTLKLKVARIVSRIYVWLAILATKRKILKKLSNSSKKPDVLKRIQAQRKRPLKDAAAVNSTRWALFNQLKKTELPVTTGSGGQTKFNRTRLQLPKCHWLDAACVGKVEELKVLTSQPLLIKAAGHGTR